MFIDQLWPKSTSGRICQAVVLVAFDQLGRTWAGGAGLLNMQPLTGLGICEGIWTNIASIIVEFKSHVFYHTPS